jgi:signal transduction histidine kinase
MSFRNRLALFLIVTLVGVQALTALLAYGIVRSNLVQQGRQELAATAGVFMRQLRVLSGRVADDVEVLSLDYALRKAVGEHDEATALSALKNHGNRIGATRMLLLDLDGKITADTGRTDSMGKAFPFGGLLEAAGAGDQATSLAVLDGEVYWIVIVPVRAPLPIAFIAASVPVDDDFLEELRQLSSVPQSLALATPDSKGVWAATSKTKDFAAKIAIPSSLRKGPEAAVTTYEQGDHLEMVANLGTAEGSPPVVAVLDYPLEEALSAYRAVITPVLLVLLGALLVALAGAIIIARGVARPLELLATATRRIAKGDYRTIPSISRNDEIGELSAALNSMARSIGDRETALKGAVASLEVAHSEAVKANEAKSQFLSNMSHELRTPLNAIIGFSEMIHRQLVGPISQRYTDYARYIQDSGKHLLVQVEEMLALSDAADGKLSINRQRVKPGGLLAASLEALLPIATNARVTLIAPSDAASWPMIDADMAKLQQSLVNVIHNGIKFTPAGGEVRITGERAGAMLKIVVADTGIGIKKEDIPLVVRPFHRREPAFDARHQGAGLGLPFAKTIIELHGGTLSIESVEAEGTNVTIELPVAVDAALHDAA